MAGTVNGSHSHQHHRLRQRSVFIKPQPVSARFPIHFGRRGPCHAGLYVSDRHSGNQQFGEYASLTDWPTTNRPVIPNPPTGLRVRELQPSVKAACRAPRKSSRFHLPELAPSHPLSRPLGLCRWQILFATSQVAQITSSLSVSMVGYCATVFQTQNFPAHKIPRSRSSWPRSKFSRLDVITFVATLLSWCLN